MIRATHAPGVRLAIGRLRRPWRRSGGAHKVHQWRRTMAPGPERWLPVCGAYRDMTPRGYTLEAIDLMGRWPHVHSGASCKRCKRSR